MFFCFLKKRGFDCLLIVLAALVFFISFAEAQTLTGNAVDFIDGDTFTFRSSSNQDFKIRMSGVDAPEIEQDFGVKCRDALSSFLDGETIQVRILNKDFYGRYVAYVSKTDEPDVNLWTIKQGCGWAYATERSKRKLYRFEQNEAKKNALGLFSNPEAITPTEYRKLARCGNAP